MREFLLCVLCSALVGQLSAYKCDKQKELLETSVALPKLLPDSDYYMAFEMVEFGEGDPSAKERRAHWMRHAVREDKTSSVLCDAANEQWIYTPGGANVTYVNGSLCRLNETSVVRSPFSFDNDNLKVITSGSSSTWTSIVDMFTWIRNRPQAKFDSWIEKNATFAGMRLNTWVGCLKQTSVADGNGTAKLQISVGYYEYDGKNTPKPAFKAGEEGSPVYLEVLIYESISRPQIRTQPPLGVFCAGADPGEEPPSIGNFTADMQLRSNNQEYTVTDRLLYTNAPDPNGTRIAAFTYLADESKHPPFIGDLDLPDKGQFFVVHDFNYGLQYAMDTATGKCAGVKPISTKAADLWDADAETGRKMQMRDANQWILGADSPNETYSYVGERMLAGVKTRVWIGEEAGSGRTREAYFSTENWKLSDDRTGYKGPASLLALKIYSRDSKTGQVDYKKTTMIDFISMSILSGITSPSADMLLDAAHACAKFTNDSYFEFEVENLKPEVLDQAAGAREALLNIIATAANVSPLRVFEISWRLDSTTGALCIRFALAQPSGVSGAAVVDKKEELSLSDAINTLNATVNDGALVVDVGGTKITAKKSSLHSALSPTIISGGGSTVVHDGASGGAMFALAVCMLLLGAVAGVLGAWWKWKRNRGIAYQIYE